jgi:hypothetical protein
MQQWVLEAEHILGGSWAETEEQSSVSLQSIDKKGVTNQEVSLRFDKFLRELDQKLIEEELSQTERKCLKEFLRVLHNARPYLIQCYDLEDFPRTNNEMEGSIRKIKTRYRRISGRKNWSTYGAKVMDVVLHFMSGGMQAQRDGNSLKDWLKR